LRYVNCFRQSDNANHSWRSHSACNSR